MADAAVVENGKLYVHGGGWDAILASELPAKHPSLALVFVLRVEYLEASQDIPLVIDLVDEDENPLLVRIEGRINVGHAPGSKPGGPIFAPQALTFNLLEFPKHGEYRFRVTSGDLELAIVPFRVAPADK